MRLLKTSSWMSRWHNATLFVTSSNGLRQDAGGRLFFDDPSFETDFRTLRMLSFVANTSTMERLRFSNDSNLRQ